LFQPKAVVVAKPKAQTPPPPPPKTPEQLEEEAARAELTQIKLVGVVFRGDKGQAFLVKGDQTYMVSVGEKVGDRFTVDAVTSDSVQLKDPRTSVSGQIPISGK
jgi:Tfp pilus assembly protein PilP